MFYSSNTDNILSTFQWLLQGKTNHVASWISGTPGKLGMSVSLFFWSVIHCLYCLSLFLAESSLVSDWTVRAHSLFRLINECRRINKIVSTIQCNVNDFTEVLFLPLTYLCHNRHVNKLTTPGPRSSSAMNWQNPFADTVFISASISSGFLID